MQRKKGPSRKVLNHLRTDDFYSRNDGRIEAAPPRMKSHRTTGRRKIVRGRVKQDGTWSAVLN